MLADVMETPARTLSPWKRRNNSKRKRRRNNNGEGMGKCGMLVLAMMVMVVEIFGLVSVVEQAERFYANGEFDRVIQLLRTEIENGDARSLVLYGVALHSLGMVNDALEYYQRAMRNLEQQGNDVDTSFLLNNIGRAYWEVRKFEQARETLESVNTKDARTWNNLGLVYHSLREEGKAMEAYVHAIDIEPEFNGGELHFNLGVSLKDIGKVQQAADSYLQALKINPDYPEARINLAALYHEHLMLDEAIVEYKIVAAMPHALARVRRMALANLGVALTEQGNSQQAIEYFEKVLAMEPMDDVDDDDDIAARANIATARKVICDWQGYHEDLEWLIVNVKQRQLEQGRAPAHLPFDTLLTEADSTYRLQVAQAHAKQFVVPTLVEKAITINKSWKKLNIGYFSYDFNNHPTAHLVQALFKWHNRSVVTTHALSFGKDDGSEYRANITRDVDAFHDIALLSHEQAARFIQHGAQIDIIMDMQGFTRGGRPQIIAQKPAPIIVNYLVFAGTCGAPFTDYIIVDRQIAPVEFAKHYSEHLVYMPHSYQINDFHNYNPNLASPRPEELPPKGEAFVFANFNKNDKLDPPSFSLWMQILHRVPGSVLWLLEPSRKLAPAQMKKRIAKEALALGINPQRIRYAPRVSKESHLNRHIHADLFLDTVVYGAHSTATDALRGGLPVLTCVGGVLANRVAYSLLNSLDDPILSSILVTPSKKTFVDTAVRIATSPSYLDPIKRRVQRSDSASLFDSQKYTRDLERSYQVMWELHANSKGPMHIILA